MGGAQGGRFPMGRKGMEDLLSQQFFIIIMGLDQRILPPFPGPRSLEDTLTFGKSKNFYRSERSVAKGVLIGAREGKLP